MRWVIATRPLRMASARAILLSMVVAGMVQTAASQGISVAQKLISDAGYAHLLDAIFPRENIASLKVAYTMVLRFEPNEGPESQLLFRVWNDGHIDEEMYSVKSGSAWTLANGYISKSGKEDIAAIAPLIPVQKKQLMVTADEVQEWHAGLFDALRSSD